MAKKMILTLAAAAFMGSAFAANPLLTPQGYLNVDFTPAQMKEYTANAKQYMDGRVDDLIKQLPGLKNFQNTIGGFELALNEYHGRTQLLVLAAHFSPNVEIRKTSLEIGAQTKKYLLDIFTNRALYAALKQDPAQYTDEQQFIARQVLFEFEKNGMGLNDKDLAKFIKLKKQLIDLETAFDAALSASKALLKLKPDELKGLSPTMIASMKRDKAGNYILDITPRSVYFAFLASSEIDAKRKEAERAYQALGGKKNLDTLAKMIKIRKQVADLFGFEHYSNYALQDKMAQNFNNAAGLTADLISKMQIKAALENDKFLQLKREVTKDPSAIALTEWDWRFYADMYKKRHLNIDDEKIKEFFPLHHVVDNMLDMFGGVFGVKFEKVNIPVWHKDVMPYAMHYETVY